MTETTALDVTITQPAPDAGEAELLLYGLDRMRGTFAWKCNGLDTAGLNRRQPPSTMTLAGLMKHLALVEDYYTARDLTGEPIGAPWDAVDFDADPQWEWRTSADDSPADLSALWSAAVARTRAAMSRTLAEVDPDRPLPLSTAAQPPTLRLLLIDLHEEYARHVGHADLLREAVDGLVGEDPRLA